MKTFFKLISNINEYFTPRIFWISLILFFIGMAAFSPIKPRPFGDRIFNVEAKIIANKIKGIETERAIKFDHSVIPTLFYIVPALLSDSNYESSMYFLLTLTWNLLSFLLSIWLYIKAFKLTDNLSRLLLLLMLLVIPYFIYYHLTFSSEAISFLLIAGISYLAMKQNEHKNTSRIVYIGILFGILIANRPNFIFFIPLSMMIAGYLKKWYILAVPALAIFMFFIFTQVYKLGNTETNRDKFVFLLEQIHGGMFFMRSEFTDWSFFNNEYREQSIDYYEYQSSKQTINNDINLGENPRTAYLNEIYSQIKQKPYQSIIHPIKKFIHGNSIHIGSKTPGKLSLSYLSIHYKTFAVNIFLNLLNWAVIILGLYFLLKTFRQNEFMAILLLATILAFNAFNMLSASEQRYLFPTKILYIIYCITFIKSKVNENSAA